MNSGMVEWINQWMDDLKHTCGFVYSFWFTCKKGSVKANRTKQKKINIVFGPDQSKWTSGLSWCEYTLSWISVNRWVRHIQLINNFRAHSRSVFKVLSVIVKIYFPMEKMNGVFTSRTQLLRSIKASSCTNRCRQTATGTFVGFCWIIVLPLLVLFGDCLNMLNRVWQVLEYLRSDILSLVGCRCWP